MRIILGVSIGIFILFSPGHLFAELENNLSPDTAIKQLIEGNQRYRSGQSIHPRQEADRRDETSTKQKPFAAVLSCSDSRVAPEIIFDQGLGDIFSVRLAGHVLDNAALASLEYAAEHLGIAVIVVLGHERCGAVTAAASEGHLPGHLPALIDKIKPVIEKARLGGKNPDVEQCISENVRYVADQLRNAPPIIREMAAARKIKIAAGKYDLDTGEVEFF